MLFRSQIFPEMSMLNGKVTTGLLLDSKIVNDYTSLLVRARVVRDGNVGTAALIVYHDDKPVAERAAEEEAKNVLDSIDFKKMF